MNGKQDRLLPHPTEDCACAFSIELQLRQGFAIIHFLELSWVPCTFMLIFFSGNRDGAFTVLTCMLQVVVGTVGILCYWR